MLSTAVHRRFICDLFFFQAEDGIRDLVRSRGLGDVYKRQPIAIGICQPHAISTVKGVVNYKPLPAPGLGKASSCLLYTSDAADERSSVDLGGRRIIKKQNRQ